MQCDTIYDEIFIHFNAVAVKIEWMIIAHLKFLWLTVTLLYSYRLEANGLRKAVKIQLL